MNTFSKMAIVVISTLFPSGGYALAECGDMAKSKDQVIASFPADHPLEDHATIYTQKDGTNVPLGESRNLATSEQDVAQDQHQPTATAQGEEHTEKCALEEEQQIE